MKEARMLVLSCCRRRAQVGCWFVIIYNKNSNSKMIISNQQIAIHLQRLRNLSAYTSGRFLLRLALHQRHAAHRHPALPLTIIDQHLAEPNNRSQFDDQHFFSRAFTLKSGAHVDLDEIFIFKLDSPLAEAEEEPELVLAIQLLHSDAGKCKSVGSYCARLTPLAAHQYLQIDYNDPAPVQIVGSFHRLPYKFGFREGTVAVDLAHFCDKYYRGKADEFLEYLQEEGFKNYERLAEHLGAVHKEQPELDADQLERRFVFKVLQSQIDLYERETELSMCESEQLQALTQGKETQAKGKQGLAQAKPRKGLFSVSRDHARDKFESFEKHLHKTAEKTYLLWRQLLQQLVSKEGEAFLRDQAALYHSRLREKVKESITSCKGSKDSDLYGSDFNFQAQLVSKLRNPEQQLKASQVQEEDFPVQNTAFFTSHRPIFFEEKSEHYAQEQAQEIFVFLVHGLGACRLDMEKLKVELRRYYEGTVRVHSATTNEGRTESDIDSLGLRLASEIEYELSKLPRIPKICLIGHSMGGLIIRSALPRLQKYKKHFHSLVTFSSPHLGYAYSVSRIVDAGLWYMNTVKKCTSLMQMTMKDHQRPELSFLYKLSSMPGLEWFKKIVLVGSHQDRYVPYYSARIQKHRESIQDQKENVVEGKVYCEMVHNIFRNVTGTIIRLNVNFSIPENNLDNLIGRAAHLNFITNLQMVRAFALSAKHYIF